MTITASRHLSFADICSQARERINEISGKVINPVILKFYASEACVEFAALSECARGEQKRVLIAGESEYRLPPDCLKPLQVSVLYPDDAAEKALDVIEYRDLLDNFSTSWSSSPSSWCLTPDRTRIKIFPEPEKGGGEFITTGAGNVGGTTVVFDTAAASDVNDFYNGMELRIVDGTLEGQEQTISDYDGTTHTATVDTAFSAQVPATTRIEIGPETLIIQYVRQGNHYEVTPTTATVQAAPVPTYSTFGLNLPDRPPDYWHGCEVWFTAGNLMNRRSRILTATSVSASLTTVTVFPELHLKPAATDTVTVTDVPNIPERYHHYLVEYIVEKCLMPTDKTSAMRALARFEGGVADARRFNDPPEGENFDQVREHRYSERWTH